MSAGPHPSPAAASEVVPEAEHEFSDVHKEKFRALATSLSFAGVCTILFGCLACVFFVGQLYAGFVPSALATAVGAALCIATGWWTMSAGRSLSALVGTRGRDVEHLMAAITQFQLLFGLARAVIVAVALLSVAAGGLIVWCTLVVDPGGKCFGLSW